MAVPVHGVLRRAKAGSGDRCRPPELHGIERNGIFRFPVKDLCLSETRGGPGVPVRFSLPLGPLLRPDPGSTHVVCVPFCSVSSATLRAVGRFLGEVAMGTAFRMSPVVLAVALAAPVGVCARKWSIWRSPILRSHRAFRTGQILSRLWPGSRPSCVCFLGWSATAGRWTASRRCFRVTETGRPCPGLRCGRQQGGGRYWPTSRSRRFRFID